MQKIGYQSDWFMDQSFVRRAVGYFRLSNALQLFRSKKNELQLWQCYVYLSGQGTTLDDSFNTNRLQLMKTFLLTTIQLLVASQLLAQSFFDAEGKKIKTGTIRRNYKFSYTFNDSLSLFFTDSIVIYSNPNKTIVKTVSYSSYDKNRQPAIEIQYFRMDGQDSLSKHFSDGKLSMTYKTKYDHTGKITYYGMKDFNADPTYDRGFEWFYEYRDSLISTGKIVIQTVFVDDAHGDKRFHFRVLNEYDNDNRKIKEMRESQPNDPMAQVATYSYNENGRLISENVVGTEMLSSSERQINTKCGIEKDYSFTATTFNSVNQLVRQLLLNKKNTLTTNECENYFLTLIAPDKQTKLTIVKRKPYREGRQVVFTTIQTLQ